MSTDLEALLSELPPADRTLTLLDDPEPPPLWCPVISVDDDGHIFENAIDKLGTAKVTLGCNPPTNNKYCPNDYVTRGQMAAFLKRALTK